MRQTLRQIVAVLALAGIAMSLVPNALAASYTDLSAANKLASMDYIVDQSATPAAYRLGETLLRQEGVGTAGKVLGIIPQTPVSDYDCMDKFSDVSEAWVCRAAELAAKAGLTNAANTTFRPMDSLTKYEGMLFALRASCMIPEDRSVSGVAAYAADAGIITNAASFNGTAAITRGTFFQYVATALEDSACGDTTDEDVLCTLFPDLCVDDGGDVVTPTGGDVEVSLADSTPDSMDLPKSAEGVAVADFDVTAGDTDVSISSVKLTRKGLGSDVALSVALFANGSRVSKVKTFNSSNDTAEVVLSPAIVVEAGETVTLTAKVNTDNTTGTFAIELTSLVSTADDLGGTPVTANTFEVKDVAATSIVIDDDGSVSAPKLGALQADVQKFSVKNDTNSAEDVTLYEITFKEDGSIDENSELANVSLYLDGEKVAEGISNGSKYFTFSLDEPLVIKDGKTEKFVIKSDIIGGASETVSFIFDNDLDVTATASKYGYISVSATAYTVSSSTVQAGEVTLTAIEPTMTDVREDKDDIILGKIKVSPKGNELELSKVKFTVDSIAGDLNLALENFELYDETNGVTYDLTATASGNDVILTETDLSVLIKGDTTLAVRADTLTSIGSFDGYDFKLVLSLDTNAPAGITSADVGFVLKETGDDELVTDITPSTLTWKTISGQESSAAVSMIVMSDTIAVIGTNGVEVAQFQVSADDSSALEFTEAKVHLLTDAVDTTSAQVSAVYLYQGSTLLDQVSGSQLASGVATFDSFKETIAKSGKVTYTVKVDLVDDATQAGKVVNLDTLISIDVEDEDGDDVTATGLGDPSLREVTIAGVGTLAITVDNTDSATDKAKNVMANTTSQFVASFELTATNEAAMIKDLEVTGTGTNFVESVSEVILYKNDKITEIDRENVTDTTITFNNVNYIAEEGNSNIYVKVVARKIGKNSAGVQTGDLTLAVQATDVEGNDSGKAITLGGGVAAPTSASLAFSILPVRISTIAFVSTYGGETVASNLTNGENTVAIIAVTTDSSTNTKTDGTSLKTELESMIVTVNTDAAEFDNDGGTGTAVEAGSVTAITVEKINGTVAATTLANDDGTALAADDELAGAGLNLFRGVSLGADEEVDNGTVYYVVKATFSGLSSTTNKYFQLKLDNLDSGSTVEYSSNNVEDADNTYVTGDNITALRIGATSLSGPSISSNY